MTKTKFISMSLKDLAEKWGMVGLYCDVESGRYGYSLSGGVVRFSLRAKESISSIKKEHARNKTECPKVERDYAVRWYPQNIDDLVYNRAICVPIPLVIGDTLKASGMPDIRITA